MPAVHSHNFIMSKRRRIVESDDEEEPEGEDDQLVTTALDDDDSTERYSYSYPRKRTKPAEGDETESDGETAAAAAPDEDDDLGKLTTEPVEPVKKKAGSKKPKADKFETLSKKHKQSVDDQVKYRKAVKDLKADLERKSCLQQVKAVEDFQGKLTTLYSKKYALQIPGVEKKQQVSYFLTNKPCLHYMSHPKLPCTKADATPEDKELYEKSNKKFLDELHPSHMATMQAVDLKRGVILQSKDVLFDRLGVPKEWNLAMATALVSNYPDLLKEAIAKDNKRPATLKATASMTSTTNKAPIDWFSHILPQLYYIKQGKAIPLEPPKETPKPKAKPKPDEPTPVPPASGDSIVESMLGLMKQKVHEEEQVCKVLRELYMRVHLSLTMKADSLNGKDVYWLLFCHLLFRPSLQHTILVSPHTLNGTAVQKTKEDPNEWEVIGIRYMTSVLLDRFIQYDNRACHTLQEMYTTINNGFKSRNISDQSIQWLLFGFLIYYPGAYHLYNAKSILERPYTSGKKPLVNGSAAASGKTELLRKSNLQTKTKNSVAKSVSFSSVSSDDSSPSSSQC